MGRQVQIKIDKEKTGESCLVSGTPTDDDVLLFTEFITFAQELIKTKYFSLDQQASLNISFKNGEGTTVRAKLPPPEVCDALILRLRPFVLHEERTSFNNVCARLAARFDSDIVRLLLRGQRDLWSGKQFRSMMRVEDGFGVLNSDDTVMAYLNAFEYHRDPKKRERLEWPKQFLGEQGLRAFFLMLLTEKVRAIMNIADFCSTLLGRNQGARTTTD